jgi:hypothetical protein
MTIRSAVSAYLAAIGAMVGTSGQSKAGSSFEHFERQARMKRDAAVAKKAATK